MHELAEPVACWALTYALHATAFLGLAWLVERRWLPEAARETLWRLAMLGAVATATLQVGFALEPWSGAWQADLGPLEPSTSPPALPVPAARAPGVAVPADEVGTWCWLDVLLCAWAAVAAIGLVRLAWLYLHLRLHLQPQRPAPELAAEVARLAPALRLRRLPRVTVSARAPTPLALGLARPEICVPERALRELDGDELRAMLAHELAHTRRRDPAWALLYAVVSHVLFWHPAPWLARRRLLALAETRCDALASASAPLAGLALARALLRAAEWLVPAPRGLAAAHGRAMAASRGGLQRRVQLLLATPRPVRRGGVWGAQAVLGVLFGGAPCVLPAVVQPPVAAAQPLDLPAPPDLPAPLASLVRDVDALRAEVRELNALAAQAHLTDDPLVGELLREIERRMQALATRCADVVARHRLSLVSDPLPVR